MTRIFAVNIIACSLGESEGQQENRGDVVTHPCQRDGPEGYDSPVPASERPGHQAQAGAWQANKCTAAHAPTLTRTTNQIHTAPFTETDKLPKKKKKRCATLQRAIKF